MNSLLSATVPSYNVAQHPISDAATLVRPANLRGLPPDSTLILVNGKRRHRASVITFLGGGISSGAHAPDLASIPAIALKRVEILRDGAAAQYGSDAVAGVINFVLKDAPDSGTAEARWGQFYRGDGSTPSVAANLGLPLPFIESGFANFSFEYREADPTSRSIQRDSAQALINKYDLPIRDPAVIWGSPEVHHDYKFFGNLGLKLNSNSEVYAFGNYAERKIEGGFYYRHPAGPNARDGVFQGNVFNKNDPTGTPVGQEDDFKFDADKHIRSLKVFDLTDDGSGNCSDIPLSAGVDVEAEVAKLKSTDCFAFNEQFPGGFTPTFGGTVRDLSAAVGIRGDISHANVWHYWHYDLSAVFGQHSTDFFMTKTINPQLLAKDEYRTMRRVPTNYNPGAYTERDHVINLDLSRSIKTNMFPSPLNVGVGLEYRKEEFEVELGGENSWFTADSISTQKGGAGSNGFVGFGPDFVVKNNRGSYAAYVDLETDVVKDVLVGVAGRFEEYETFGDTLNGKVNARWQATDLMALRGSLSTGFRAPTVGQTSIRNVTTSFATGKLANEGTFPPNDPVALANGATQLQPEKSITYSAGTVANIGRLSVTIDYYRIKVRDRIFLSKLKEPDPPIPDISAVRYFTNGFDATSQGVDLVATYPMKIAGGTTTLTLTGNWNQTRVTNAKIDIAALQKRLIEEGLPNARFSLMANHQQGPWRFLTRLHFYDDYFDAYEEDPDENNFTADDRWLVDLEGSYTFKSNGITLATGAQNLFSEVPSKDPNDNGARYSRSSPYGFNGGFYYFRAFYAF